MIFYEIDVSDKSIFKGKGRECFFSELATGKNHAGIYY